MTEDELDLEEADKESSASRRSRRQMRLMIACGIAFDSGRHQARAQRLRTTALQAVLCVFDATYDLVDGVRKCRICGALKHDYANAHAPGCEVNAALEEAWEMLK